MIGALIGAGASILGGLLSSSSTKKAANKAADAQLQATQQNNALVRELYDRNTGNFTPYMQSGARANALVDSFLYGGGPEMAQIGPQSGQPMAGPQTYSMAGPQGQFAYNDPGGNEPRSLNVLGDMDRIAPNYGLDGAVESPMSGAYGISPYATPPISGDPRNLPPQAQGGMNGYQQFVASPFYQNPLTEGYRALDHRLAASGMNESGAGLKAALRFGSDYGHGRMMDYIGLAQNQAGRGFGAASALAGVGQNMVDNISANNRTSANALSNAAIVRGNANAQMWNGIGNELGSFASSYLKGL